MRDLVLLSEPGEIESYVRGLWRTDLFRRSHAAGGYIGALIERFAALPRIFFTMDEPDIERGHFAPWFGAIGLREYENPAIHDLFYFHEVYHMVTLSYDASVSWEEWAAKMAMNEIRASVNSEAMVYFHLRGLRQLTFEREIWADRFLQAPSRFNEADLILERWRATLFPRDLIERRVALFQAENRRWAELWRANWRVVEGAMERLSNGAQRDRTRALEKHAEWLAAQFTDPARPYPFPLEAQGFAEIYWETRERSAVLA